MKMCIGILKNFFVKQPQAIQGHKYGHNLHILARMKLKLSTQTLQQNYMFINNPQAIDYDRDINMVITCTY